MVTEVTPEPSIVGPWASRFATPEILPLRLMLEPEVPSVSDSPLPVTAPSVIPLPDEPASVRVVAVPSVILPNVIPCVVENVVAPAPKTELPVMESDSAVTLPPKFTLPVPDSVTVSGEEVPLMVSGILIPKALLSESKSVRVSEIGPASVIPPLEVIAAPLRAMVPTLGVAVKPESGFADVPKLPASAMFPLPFSITLSDLPAVVAPARDIPTALSSVRITLLARVTGLCNERPAAV